MDICNVPIHRFIRGMGTRHPLMVKMALFWSRIRVSLGRPQTHSRAMLDRVHRFSKSAMNFNQQGSLMSFSFVTK
jgi:hypothetical protein